VRTNGWVYEDANAAWANPAVLGQQPIDITRARWLTALSHRLVFTFISQSPQASHLTNLTLHLTNGVLVYAVAGAWLTPFGALATTAAFLLHPLQTEAVAYAASRSELLATFFALVAFWFWEHKKSAREHGKSATWNILGAWFCVLLAVCAKESAAVIVPLMVLADIVRGRPLSKWWLVCLLLPIIAVAASVFRFDYLTRSEIGPLGYAATQAIALCSYLSLAIWPYGLSIDHDFELVPWIIRWIALVSVTVVTLAASLLLLTSSDEQGRRARLFEVVGVPVVVLFGWLWVVVAFAPRFVMRTPEVINEHQVLLPFIGLWLIFGAIVGGERS
jgi:hypothetical protein